MAMLGYQPLVFPEQEVVVLSMHVWREVWAALVQTAARNQRLAEDVWLSSCDLPLQVVSQKLAPRYMGRFVREKVLNPSVMRLRLPASMNAHPVCHVSFLKPVSSCPLGYI